MITFTTIEEYVAWRAQWREDYKKLSQDIRNTKSTLREGMRNRQYESKLQYYVIPTLKAQATQMIRKREFAKEKAIEIWNARIQGTV